MRARATIRPRRGRAEGFPRPASKSTWMRQATPLPPAPGRSSRAPAYPKRAPVVVAARSARRARARGARARLAAARERVHRGDRHQRQDHDHRVDRPHPPRGGRCRWRWPATSARPLSSLVGQLEPEATVVCEASSFQLEDTEAFAPEAAVLLNLAPDHLDRHRELRGLRRPPSCGSSPTRAATTSPSCRSTSGSRTSAAARGGSRSAPAPRPSWPIAAGYLWWDERAAAARRRDLAARASTTVQNAMAAAAACLARGIEPRRGRRAGCAASPASPTGSS